MSPLFSLILPVYNVEAYLERCIRSILAQSFTDYEIILVDDGSRDGSSALCDEFAAEHGCIRVIHKENGGLSSARNAGLAQAAGEYVWFVDSDDWIEPGALETLLRVCRDAKHDIVKFGYFRSENGEKRESLLGFSGVYSGEGLEAMYRRALCEPGKYILSAWAHVYRRAFLKEYAIEFVSERVIGSEDYLLNLTALMRAQSICAIDKALYAYELRGGSLTQQYKPDLPQRYERLYHMLKAQEKENASMARCAKLIDRFYVWHLVFGTCFSYEYLAISDSHSLSSGRRNVKQMLGCDDMRNAVRRCDRTGLTWKRRLQLLAMRLQLEPFFFWLFVGNKSRR